MGQEVPNFNRNAIFHTNVLVSYYAYLMDKFIIRTIFLVIIGVSLSEPHTSKYRKYIFLIWSYVRSIVSRIVDTNQNFVNHSIFGCTYVQQCHGFRDTSQGFVNLHVHSTVSRNLKQHNPKSRKLFHFRSNVRSTVSRILNIYAESRKSSIVNHCIKHVRLK